ncbi:MAG: hypothetical protein PWQ39_444 [Thermacetogenium sp.]|jgi:hypothetical protein|nr:hypothetical protein [Thermacetogenium sp.]
MSKRWLKDFLRYIHKVFLPEGWTKWAKDERKDPPSADTIRHSSIGMKPTAVKKLFAAVINKAAAARCCRQSAVTG